ncbi:hypothetical protein JCM8097_008397 [Rhodosporidiobolus ruineniae]
MSALDSSSSTEPSSTSSVSHSDPPPPDSSPPLCAPLSNLPPLPSAEPDGEPALSSSPLVRSKPSEPILHVDVDKLPDLIGEDTYDNRLLPWYDPDLPVADLVKSSDPPPWSLWLESYYRQYHPEVWRLLEEDHQAEKAYMLRLEDWLDEAEREGVVDSEERDGIYEEVRERAERLLDRFAKLHGLHQVRQAYLLPYRARKPSSMTDREWDEEVATQTLLPEEYPKCRVPAHSDDPHIPALIPLINICDLPRRDLLPHVVPGVAADYLHSNGPSSELGSPPSIEEAESDHLSNSAQHAHSAYLGGHSVSSGASGRSSGSSGGGGQAHYHPSVDPALLALSHSASSSSSASTTQVSIDLALASLVLERHHNHPNKPINWDKVADKLASRVYVGSERFEAGWVRERWETLANEVQLALGEFKVDPSVGLVNGENASPFIPEEDSLLLASIANLASSTSSPSDFTSALLVHPHTDSASSSAWCLVRERTKLGLSTPLAAASLPTRSLESLHLRYLALKAARDAVAIEVDEQEGDESEWSAEQKQGLMEAIAGLGGRFELPDAGWTDGCEGAARWVVAARTEGVGKRSVMEVIAAWEERRIEVFGKLLSTFLPAPPQKGEKQSKSSSSPAPAEKGKEKEPAAKAKMPARKLSSSATTADPNVHPAASTSTHAAQRADIEVDTQSGEKTLLG